MILRSAVPHSRSAFHRLLEPLDRRVIARVVAAHGGDRGVGSGDKAWTCERHLKSLLFAQWAGLTSLRQIVAGLGAHEAPVRKEVGPRHTVACHLY
jgi:putative transposase